MENAILPSLEAKKIAQDFYEEIHKTGFITKDIPTSILYEENGGAMFGFLLCETKTGERILLKAYSGKLNGSFINKDFVPPCFSNTKFLALEEEYSPTLHSLTDRINAGEEELKAKRTALMLECLEKTKALYTFYSIDGKKHTLKSLNINQCPTGTGDCATIKLLNTAFKKGYTLLSMAEMFIGNGKGKKDGVFYPPCSSRCGLLLPHMLKLNVIFADDDILAIDKAAGLLSVPGRGEDKYDSASVRVHNLVPSSPLLPSVHRLDMDTSGVLVFALTEDAKKKLSMQFEKRETEKTYIAIVEGAVKEEYGVIDKPMRLDVDNRPYQIIDAEKGKSALTEFWRDKIFYLDNRLVTRLIVKPKTGRTHQIRVHLSSIGFPIVGDRLYGSNKNNERLLLHAENLVFTHPSTGERMSITAKPTF